MQLTEYLSGQISMVRNFTQRLLFTVLLALSAPALVIGAQQGIGVSLINYTIDSANSANLGYTITINAQLTNFDSVQYSGVIDFGLRNSHFVITNSTDFGTPPYTGNTIILHGHETVPAIFSVHLDPQYFAPGPDVVVVWPICPSPHADSIVIQFTVNDPTAVSDSKNEPIAYALTQTHILLRNLPANINFKQVRIYNLIGQNLMQLQANNITDIPLPQMPKGIYLCEMLAADNTTRVIRFFH